MPGMKSHDEDSHRARQALVVWGAFILSAIVVNGTVPFALGVDLHAWTYSPVKATIFGLVVYAGLFMVVPLILTKGWTVALQRGFLIPLLVAVIGITLRTATWPTMLLPTAVSTVVMLAYLHWRFDLSDLGIRSHGWRATWQR